MGPHGSDYQRVDVDDDNDLEVASPTPTTATTPGRAPKPWDDDNDNEHDLTGHTVGESDDDDDEGEEERVTLLLDDDNDGTAYDGPGPRTKALPAGGSGSGRRVWRFVGALILVGLVVLGSIVGYQYVVQAPLRRLAQMRVDFDHARSLLEAHLRKSYGTYYDDLFFRTVTVWDERLQTNVTRQVGIGRVSLESPTPDGISTNRMRQRLQRKLLQVLLTPPPSSSSTTRKEPTDQNENDNNNRTSPYPADPHLKDVEENEGGAGEPDYSEFYDPSPPKRKHAVSFVWASGGHSAAAGHGNLYAESYTAYLQRIGQPIFDAVGMDLEGRNYAMGGFSSYPEVALCVNELYGTDADVLSWDFGMTDGFSTLFGIYQYFFQASMGPNRPACVAIEPAGDQHRPNGDVMQQLESRGLTALTLSLRFDDHSTIDRIPDSFGISDAETNALPPYVRNFKCEGGVEKGLPYCGEDKFNKDYCPDRKFQTSWHPGWKWQALRGYYLALGLVEFLDDALVDLTDALHAQDTPDPRALLDALDRDHDDNYQRFAASDIPIDVTTLRQKYPLAANLTDPPPDGGYDLTQLYQRAPFCHTALLPSEIRYKGIVNSANAGGIVTSDNAQVADVAESSPESTGPLHFDVGVSQQFLWSRNYSDPNVLRAGSGAMTLAFDQNDRQQCEVPANLDYKDFFFVHQKEGWRKVVLPTDAELTAYAHKKKPALEGRIAVCLPGCAWGKCPNPNDLKIDAFTDGRVEVRVNGLAVTAVDKLNGCAFLRHGYGDSVFPPNEQGKFDIRARVLQENGFVQFSSFIIW